MISGTSLIVLAVIMPLVGYLAFSIGRVVLVRETNDNEFIERGENGAKVMTVQSVLVPFVGVVGLIGLYVAGSIAWSSNLMVSGFAAYVLISFSLGYMEAHLKTIPKFHYGWIGAFSAYVMGMIFFTLITIAMVEIFSQT